LITFPNSAVPEQLDVYRSFPAFHFVEGSILGEELVTELLHTVDGVIHLAAETYVDKSIISSRPFWMTNVIGTLTLIEAACRSSLQKFVHVSTDEVWGQALGDVSFSENSPYRPRNPYAASKAAADHLVQSAGETYHLPHNIVHFTNLYGPFQHPEKLIPKTITHLMQGKKVPVFGKGAQMRAWLHVSDAVDGLLKVFWEAPVGEAFIVGSDICLQNIEVVSTILRLMDRSEESIAFVEDRPGHDFRYAVDCQKAHRLLGWTAEYSLMSALPSLIEWYQQNKVWVEKRV